MPGSYALHVADLAISAVVSSGWACTNVALLHGWHPCSARVSRTLGGPDSQSSEDAVRHHQGLLGPTDVSFLLNDVIVPALGPMLRNVSSILPCWCDLAMSGRSV